MYLWLVGWLLAWFSGWLVFVRRGYVPKDTTADMPDRLSIIIPARNEAANLPQLFRSLQAQQIDIHEVLVIDDGSTDQTQAVAQRFGATVLATKTDQPGKAAACWQGAQAASGTLLLFLDADTAFLTTGGISQIVAAFQNKGNQGLMSVQPYHQVQKVYEQLSYVFNVVLMAGLNRFSVFGESVKAGGAFGPCLLCTRQAYQEVSGHQDMALGILDDIALAKRFMAAQRPIHLYGGRGLLAFRMYPKGFKQLIQGWTKDFATAAQVTNPGLMVGIILWLIGNSTIPCVGLLYSWPIAAVCYAVFYGQNVYFAKRVGTFRRDLLILFPGYFCFFLCLFAWSAIQTYIRKSVVWKDRKIHL